MSRPDLDEESGAALLAGWPPYLLHDCHARQAMPRPRRLWRGFDERNA